LPCTVYWKSSAYPFLFTGRVICAVLTAHQPQITTADLLCRGVDRWVMQSSNPVKEFFFSKSFSSCLFQVFNWGSHM